MERQANLERLGWRFVRIRGSIFFRDEERAMRPLLQRLSELGITADRYVEMEVRPADEMIQRITRRAQELRSQWRHQSGGDNRESLPPNSKLRLFQ
jgi:hypothetical protein